MLDKRKQQYKENLDKCYKVVQQSSSGISAIAIAKKLKPGRENAYRTTVHRYLNTLELMGKVYSEHGLWYPEGTSIQEKPLLEESEEDKAIALQIMVFIQTMGDGVLTKEDWDYFYRDDGKGKLDKARHLLILKNIQADMRV